MASLANVTENSILLLIYNATTWANYAINASSTPETNIIVGLNTADPGETGTMSTSEAAYTSYARVSVARTSGGWTVTANSVSPVANIDFPASGASGSTITNFTHGKSGGGATDVLYYGTVTPNIAIGAAGITPRLTTASANTID